MIYSHYVFLCIYASRDLVVTGMMIRVSERDRCVNDVPFDFRLSTREAKEERDFASLLSSVTM